MDEKECAKDSVSTRPIDPHPGEGCKGPKGRGYIEFFLCQMETVNDMIHDFAG